MNQDYSNELESFNKSLNFNKFIKQQSIFREYFKYSNTYPINKRVKIDTGKFCNASCNFCYYLPHLNSKTFLKEEDLVFIPKLLANGIREFEFSGGEPTLHPNLQGLINKIITLAKREDVPEEELNFSIVTNGIKVKEASMIPQLNEFLISIHGTEETHDKIIGSKGAFKRILDFISSNFKQDFLIRVNVVVSKDNAQNLRSLEFIELLKSFISLNIQINLLPHNFWSEAQAISKNDETEIYNTLNTISDELFPLLMLRDVNNLSDYPNSKLRSPILNIRYAQVCKLDESTQVFARGHLDHYFDQHDWNKIYYPSDANPDILNNYSNLDTEINHLSILESLAKESSVSHYKDRICANCKSFSCDGRKIIDQSKNLVFKETIEEFRQRKAYARENQIRA